MEKVHPWCGQPSDQGRLKDRTELVTDRDADRRCRLERRRRGVGDADRDLDRRRAISTFILRAFCFALKNSNSPSFSQPSLHHDTTTSCCYNYNSNDYYIDVWQKVGR